MKIHLFSPEIKKHKLLSSLLLLSFLLFTQITTSLQAARASGKHEESPSAFINGVKKVVLHEGRFSTQLVFYFNNPLFCKKKINQETHSVKLGFPGMQTSVFREQELTSCLTTLKAKGIITDYLFGNKDGSVPQVNLSMTFPSEKERAVLVKWSQLESPTRFILDIFSYKQLDALKKQSNILLYASNNGTLFTRYRQKRAKDLRIIIDPGHGGNDPGCINYGIKEKEITLTLAQKIQEQLRNEGFSCSLTRNHDKTVSLQERTILADQMQADIFVSVHANSAAHISDEVSGLETYYLTHQARAKTPSSGIFSPTEATPPHDLQDLLDRSVNHSADLAQEIQQNTLKALHQKEYSCINRGVKQNSAVVLLKSLIPSALVEVGYTSHKQEAARLTCPHYQELLAQGITQGIKAYIKKHYFLKK